MTSAMPFKPARVQRHPGSEARRPGSGGDTRDGQVYVYHDRSIEIAVNVAVATRRPLLLSGQSGCGKSSLALNVALSFGARYYEHVVTARSQASDLMWSVDHVQRLNDANLKKGELKPLQAYVNPGVLWWAFDPSSAQSRGQPQRIPPDSVVRDPAERSGSPEPVPSATARIRFPEAVVLIDEIDKADPDLPNNLLVPIGSLQFTVEPTGFQVIASAPPLIFITTNGERALPLTFLRRCVTLRLPTPSEKELVEIAVASFPEYGARRGLFESLAEHAMRVVEQEPAAGLASPSIAEYLDIIRACLELGLDSQHPDFEQVSRITLRKHQSAEAFDR